MIPPRNLYYMLLYAWGHFRAGETELVGSDDSPNLPTLLAKVLNSHAHRLLRRGLDRGYLALAEEGRSIRGRILVSEIAKRQTVKLRGTAVYEYDELSTDILHNQILFETLFRLSRSDRIEQGVRHEVGLTAKRFREVSRIRLTADLFSRVMLSRNTSQYALLMHICELLFRELMPDTKGFSNRFKSIDEDKVRMEALFEEFLRSFYRAELPDHKVLAKEYQWAAGAGKDEDLALIPKMRTDITVSSAESALTIEAKYNQEVFVESQFGGKKLRSGHLYQLHAYLSHASHYAPHKEHRGLLIYAERERPIDADLTILGRRLRIGTVNLTEEWKTIHNRLLQLVD